MTEHEEYSSELSDMISFLVAAKKLIGSVECDLLDSITLHDDGRAARKLCKSLASIDKAIVVIRSRLAEHNAAADGVE